MTTEEISDRFFRGDPLIFEGPTAATSIGWLHHPSDLVASLRRFAAVWFEDRAPRHDRTIVLGMGGPSVAAGMFAGLIGASKLSVLDTSNPDTIAATDFSNCNVIASSKSGTTIETVTTLAWALSHGLKDRDLSIITDPTSPLAQLGESLGAKLFYGDVNTGGRFGALSAFGLVPALAAGWDPAALVASGFDGAPERFEMARWFAEGAHSGVIRDYEGWFPLATAPRTGSTELWLEQLVAESTGKRGRGVIPIVDGTQEHLINSETVVRDLFSHQVRVAAMAWRLGVDPFDQPDVEGAKRNVFGELRSLEAWRAATTVTNEQKRLAADADYVALQVFGPLSIEDEMERLRQRLSTRFTRITAGLGPRFLHATGQLHKGGPINVTALQVSVRPRSEPERISGRNYSFHDLHMAQARADARAMRSAGRTVIEFRVDDLDEVGSLFEV